MLVADGQQSNFGALHETWETSNSVRRADGHTLALFNPYFQVRLPSRFHDPAMAPVVGRPIDVCYEVTATGEQASGGPCDRSTDDGQTAGVTFDDPRSEFNGADHFVDINANNISNADGPEIWYTDAYGQQRQDRAVRRARSASGSRRWTTTSVWTRTARRSATTGTTAGAGCGRRTERRLSACRSSQRTSWMPPGSSRSLVKTWVMVTTR